MDSLGLGLALDLGLENVRLLRLMNAPSMDTPCCGLCLWPLALIGLATLMFSTVSEAPP